jgi:hypothetical protein
MVQYMRGKNTVRAELKLNRGMRGGISYAKLCNPAT